MDVACVPHRTKLHSGSRAIAIGPYLVSLGVEPLARGCPRTEPRYQWLVWSPPWCDPLGYTRAGPSVGATAPVSQGPVALLCQVSLWGLECICTLWSRWWPTSAALVGGG